VAHLVFGYGSLTGGGVPARLRGWRRVWNVAMDNAVDLPGYKCYLAADGARPAVFVTFLNLERALGSVVDGELLEGDLDALDARERNYSRVDVTDALESPPGARVWAYVGTPEGRERFERGLREGRAVVQRAYLDAVGVAERPACPVVDLRRVELD
jgi:hypothetical protein